jgi:hypothetical protein
MAAPPELIWYLIRQNNASLIKQNKHSRPFSKERFNIRNVHTSRDSGFVQRRGVDIRDNNGKGVVLTLKRTKAAKQNAPASATTSVTLTRPFRASAASVAANTSDVRPDMLFAAKGRFSRIKRSQTKVGVQKKRADRKRNVRRDPNVVGL